MQKAVVKLALLAVCGYTTAQNIVIVGGDATYAMNEVVPGDWTLGNPCGVPYYIDNFINGDYTLKGDSFIQHGKLTIHGNLNYNGYTLTLLCDSSEFIETGQPLTVPEFTSNKLEVKAFPNPTTGVFHLNTKAPYTIYIYDMNGKYLRDTPDLSGLPKGMYFAYITIDNISITKKVIKK